MYVEYGLCLGGRSRGKILNDSSKYSYMRKRIFDAHQILVVMQSISCRSQLMIAYDILAVNDSLIHLKYQVHSVKCFNYT